METHKNTGQLSPRTILSVMAGLALSLFLLVTVFNAQLYTTLITPSYLVFHNTIEFFSVMVSLSIFGFGWYTFDQSKNRQALVLGAIFLVIGVIDFMHTLSFPGMSDFITPNSTNKAVLFWIVVRAFSALSFLVSAYIYPETTNLWVSKKSLIIIIIASIGLVFVGITYYSQFLPVMFVEGSGLTSLKIYSEYIIIGLFVLSFIKYWERYLRIHDRITLLYLAAFILCIFSELAFTLYKSAFDTYNMLGHIYKLVAFLLIYQGIFIASVKSPYFEILDTRDKLREKITEQEKTEDELRKEVVERKRAEEDSRQKTEELKQFFSVNLDMLCIANTSGYFLRLNPAWEETLGYSQEELLANRFIDFVHPDDTESTINAISALSSQQNVIDFTNRYRCKDGSYRWIEWRSAPSGHLIYAAAHDITERKHIEQALIQNEKLASIGTLAAGIAHEINSPLQVITGIAESSQRLLSKEPAAIIENEELLRRFGLINNNGWRIAKIVRSLLDYAHISPGNNSFPCSLNDLVQQTLVLTEHQFRSWSNITITTCLAKNLPLALLDTNSITQVLINLLTNARDAMPEGGEITIQTACDTKANLVILRITDTGTGIPEEIRGKIFNTFFTTKAAGSGTGLGLSLVSGIVKSFNGAIELEQTSKQGSAFKISFPISDASQHQDRIFTT